MTLKIEPLESGRFLNIGERRRREDVAMSRAQNWAKNIADRIEETFGYDVSMGVGANKLMAKMDSSRVKRAKMRYHQKLVQARSIAEHPNTTKGGNDVEGKMEELQIQAKTELEVELMQTPFRLSPVSLASLNSSTMILKLRTPFENELGVN